MASRSRVRRAARFADCGLQYGSYARILPRPQFNGYGMYGVIYKLTNTVNGSFYIGQTKMALAQRWARHCSDARGGAGWVLARAMRKYGITAFTREVLESCADKQALDAAEVRWIHQLRPRYNICGGGGSPGSHSEATKAKLSLAMKGRKFSAETLAKMSASQKGRQVSVEARENLRQIFAGRYLRKTPMSLAERAALVTRNRARRIHPERTDLIALYAAHPKLTRAEKISLAAKHGFATGRRKKLVGAANPMFGKQKPAHIRIQLSEQSRGEKNPFYGQKHSEAALAKMRAAHAARPPVSCPHCGVTGQLNTMKRWHFDRCRSKA